MDKLLSLFLVLFGITLFIFNNKLIIKEHASNTDEYPNIKSFIP